MALWTDSIVLICALILLFYNASKISNSKALNRIYAIIITTGISGFFALSIWPHLTVSYINSHSFLLLAELSSFALLLNFIRLDKPDFNRFPAIQTALPFVGIILVPFVRDTEFIYQLLHITFQGSLLITALLLGFILEMGNRFKASFFTSVTILGITFIVFWINLYTTGSEEIIWFTEILLALGMISASFTLNTINQT